VEEHADVLREAAEGSGRGESNSRLELGRLLLCH
jgi:hypothetical protein